MDGWIDGWMDGRLDGKKTALQELLTSFAPRPGLERFSKGDPNFGFDKRE